MGLPRNYIIRDGDAAFGLEDTFRIDDTAYVLSAEAAFNLCCILGYRGYFLDIPEQDANGRGLLPEAVREYSASKYGDLSEEEILASIGNPPRYEPACLTVIFEGENRYSLHEADIHETIVEAAGEQSGLEAYTIEVEEGGEPYMFSDKIVQRMTVFVTNLVDVELDIWEQFLQESSGLNAPDFIKALASWASYHSDKKPKSVYLSEDIDDARCVVVGPDDDFTNPDSMIPVSQRIPKEP